MSSARPVAASLGDRVRPDFPALARQIDGRPVVYLDGPGGTQVPEAVIRSVADYLAHHNANTHGAFATSVETDRMILEARAAFADFLGAPSPREIVFGANMTTLTFHLSRALGEGWQAGDEIVVTELDHQANVSPWRYLAAERGLTVQVVPFDRGAMTLDYAALERALGPRTRLVAIGAASNAVGTVNDVARAARLAREAGALCYVDAVHYAPHRLVDVEQLGCDFLVCSAYKFFGPHVGVLWGREELLARYAPPKVSPAPDTVPERWETGTLNHEGIAGAAAAVEWIAALGSEGPGGRRGRIERAMHALDEHEMALFRRMYDGVRVLPGARIYGQPADGDRTPTLAFTLEALRSDEVERRLAARGIFVWSGHFYASTVTEGLGLDEHGGVVRAGLAAYNTEAEVERFLAALAEMAKG